MAIIVKGRIRYEGPIRDFLREDEMRSDIVLSGLAPEAGESLGFGATPASKLVVATGGAQESAPQAVMKEAIRRAFLPGV